MICNERVGNDTCCVISTESNAHRSAQGTPTRMKELQGTAEGGIAGVDPPPPSHFPPSIKNYQRMMMPKCTRSGKGAEESRCCLASAATDSGTVQMMRYGGGRYRFGILACGRQSGCGSAGGNAQLGDGAGVSVAWQRMRRLGRGRQWREGGWRDGGGGGGGGSRGDWAILHDVVCCYCGNCLVASTRGAHPIIIGGDGITQSRSRGQEAPA